MSSKKTILAFLALACAGLGFSTAAHSASTCTALYEQISAAGEDIATDRIKEYFAQAEKLPDCDENFRTALARQVAVAMLSDVDEAIKSGASAAAHKKTLEESLEYYPMWMAYAMLGDIAREGRNYELAAQRYQETLQVIDDGTFTKQAPPDAVIKKIVHKAETARMLSGRYVAAPRTRGKPTGLGALNVRGFKNREGRHSGHLRLRQDAVHRRGRSGGGGSASATDRPRAIPTSPWSATPILSGPISPTSACPKRAPWPWPAF